MLNGLLRLADIRQSPSWLRAQSGRLLSGLGLAAILPRAADAARKDDRRGGNADQKDNDSKENHNGGGDAGASDRDKTADAKSVDKNADAKSEDKSPEVKKSKEEESRNSDTNDRDSSRDERDSGDREKTRAESDRQEAKRQDAAAEPDTPSRNDNAGGSEADAGRRAQDFEQRAVDVPVEVEPGPTVVTPTNPNVVIQDIPETSVAELVVEANPDVIASVSASGGFAFARSGDVTAVSGPDGATIIQSGGVVPNTTADPVEPSDDGGNNDLDFTS